MEVLHRINNAAGGMDRETNPEATDLQGNSVFNPNDYTDARNMRSKSSQVGKSVGKETIIGNYGIASVGSADAQYQITDVYPIDVAIVIEGDNHNATNVVDGLSSTTDLRVGMSITGTGIPVHTTITSITSTTAITISNVSTSSNSTSFTFATEIYIEGDTHTNTTIDSLTDTSNLIVGMYVTGTNVPANTKIASIDSTTQITLDTATTGTAANVIFTFYTTNIVLDITAADGTSILHWVDCITSGLLASIIQSILDGVATLGGNWDASDLTTYAEITTNGIYDTFTVNFYQTTNASTNASTITLYPQSVITTQEAITTDQAGLLTPIGGLDVGGTLVILSAITPEGGVGEIGVAMYNGSAYKYTRLLRSVGLNLGTNHYPDVTGENTANRLNIYWVDDYNKDKYFTYTGIINFDTDPDTALYINDPANFYLYGKIATQTQRIKYYGNANATYNSQNQSGGTLFGGDYRYAVEPLDYSGNSAGISPVSGLVNVYPANLNGDANLLCGGGDDTPTNKANILNISGLDPEIFPNFNLVVVQYVGLAVEVYSIGKYQSEAGTFQVTHNGTELQTTIDVGKLSIPNLDIVHSLNNRIIQTRLLTSNVVLREEVDFSEAFALLTLTTKITFVDSEGFYINTAGVGATNGGYFDPNNTSNTMGYMDNETYRFGGVVHYKNGTYSKAYYIFDLKINPEDDASFFATYGVSLTDNSTSLAVRGVLVSNWAAFWAAIDSVIDLSEIDYVEIVRRECVPEVLGTGSGNECEFVDTNGANDYYSMFPNGNYTANYDGTMIAAYMPQNLLTNTPITPLFGDFLYYDANPPALIAADTYKNASTDNSFLIWQNGYTSGATNYDTLTDIDIVYPKPSRDVVYGAGWNASTDMFTPTLVVANAAHTIHMIPAVATASSTPTANRFAFEYIPDGFCLITSSNDSSFINNLSTLQFFQYFRPLTNKYGSTTQGTYQTTSARQQVSITDDLDVFGGDTMVHRFITRCGTIGTDQTATDYINYAHSFFTMSRINGAMRYSKTGGYKYPFLLPSAATWAKRVGSWLEQQAEEGFEYSQSYTPRNNEQVYAPFDPTTLTNNDLPARIYYSNSKPQGSLIDYYNQTLLNNYLDLYLTNGEIAHMENINDQLFTWQRLAFMRQFYNNQGLVAQTSQAVQTQVLIGDGSVLGRVGETLSNIGSDTKWSVAQGVSRSGLDTVVWANRYYGQFMKYDSDGTIPISDQKFTRWSRENTLIVNEFAGWNTNVSPNVPIVTDTDYSKAMSPDLHRSILAVYDKRFNEFKWTANGVKTEINIESVSVYWNDTEEFAVGKIVLWNEGKSGDTPPVILKTQGYANIPQVYRSIYNPIGDPNINKEPDDAEYWEAVPLTDNTIYNYYTLVYSVDDARWFFEETPKPNLYLQWRDSYVTPAPANRSDTDTSGGDLPTIITTSDLFIHDIGDPSIWYQAPIPITPVAPMYARVAEDGDYKKLYISGFSVGIDEFFANFPTVGYTMTYNSHNYAIRQVTDSAPPYVILYENFADGVYFTLPATTTNGSQDIDMDDTTGIEVGMYVTGVGINGLSRTVDSVTPNVSINISANCNATGETTLAFSKPFEFTYQSAWYEEPYIQYLVNENPLTYKRPLAQQYHTINSPVYVEHLTDTGDSFLTDRNINNADQSDFAVYDNYYNAATHNNLEGGSDNMVYGNRLIGKWIKTKVKFGVGYISGIRAMVSSYFFQNRNQI